MPRTAVHTSVSRDPSLVALLATVSDYPGASAQLDAADRTWLRERGVPVPDRAAGVSLTEAARIARQNRGAQKSTARQTKGT
jgi:hypothetical protein